MKLTPNFSLRELTKSQTAERKGIDNTPTDEHIENLKLLCKNILQPEPRVWKGGGTTTTRRVPPGTTKKIKF